MHFKKNQFSFSDIAAECEIQAGCYSLKSSQGSKSQSIKSQSTKAFGLRITVPPALYNNPLYQQSAYSWMQSLREQIFDYGLVELPSLPLNKQNYTVAIRAPHEHSYSDNPYLSEPCQSPHQDTPPHPTAFWLASERKQSATWVMSDLVAQAFYRLQQTAPKLTLPELHQQLVPATLAAETALLLNHQPGLLLLDNSDAHNLYHAKTCISPTVLNDGRVNREEPDSPLYCFNELGLLNYIDTLDSHRGNDDRNAEEATAVAAFLRAL